MKKSSLGIVLSLLLIAVLLPPVARGQCTCEADIGGASGGCAPDALCNVADIAQVLTCMLGSNPCPGTACDVNCDGTVDLLDASYVDACFIGTQNGCQIHRSAPAASTT